MYDHLMSSLAKVPRKMYGLLLWPISKVSLKVAAVRDSHVNKK